jgi:peroxiredoxin
MIKLAAAIVISLVCVAAHAAGGYRIEGDIPGLPDGTLQLKKVFDGKILDETVAKDGRFVFSKDGPFVGDKVNLAGAGIGKAELYLEPGTICVQRDASGAIVATGTPSNDANQKYVAEVAPYSARINQSAAAAKAAKDPAEKERLQKEQSDAYAAFYEFRKAFAKKYNNTILAPEFLSAGTGQLMYADFKEMIAGFDPKAPENWYTNRLKNRMEILRRTDIGQVAPDFTLPDPAGKQVALSSLRGKYVLVDFWASWCKPCREENKNVAKLYSQYHEAGFDVISVSIDDNRDKWLKAIEEDHLPWQHVSSLTGWSCPVANQMGVAYGMSGVPYTLLLDREGRVVGHNVRGEALAKKLDELL